MKTTPAAAFLGKDVRWEEECDTVSSVMTNDSLHEDYSRPQRGEGAYLWYDKENSRHDLTEDWWNSEIKRAPGLSVSVAVAYQSYFDWMVRTFDNWVPGEWTMPTKRAFIILMQARGVTKRRGAKGIHTLYGMGLK